MGRDRAAGTFLAIVRARAFYIRYGSALSLVIAQTTGTYIAEGGGLATLGAANLP